MTRSSEALYLDLSYKREDYLAGVDPTRVEVSLEAQAEICRTDLDSRSQPVAEIQTETLSALAWSTLPAAIFAFCHSRESGNPAHFRGDDKSILLRTDFVSMHRAPTAAH
jgi:hypothetical protein